jgi:hypothetical protein
VLPLPKPTHLLSVAWPCDTQVLANAVSESVREAFPSALVRQAKSRELRNFVLPSHSVSFRLIPSHSVSEAWTAASGSVNQNVDPSPTTLSMPIWPPGCASMICLQAYKPIPTLPALTVRLCTRTSGAW